MTTAREIALLVPMPTLTFDLAAFVAKLERVRNERRKSWRQVAAETELEPSTIQRIVYGFVPDLAHFTILLDCRLPPDALIHGSPGRVDVNLGTGQVIELRLTPSKALTPWQLRHVRGAIEVLAGTLKV